MLLDLYGTVVQEDGPLIRSIIRQIVRDHPEHSGPALTRAWGATFSDLVGTSYGPTFRTQRESEVAPLSSLFDLVGPTLDPTELVREQFSYSLRPDLRAGIRDFLASCRVPVCGVEHR